MKQDTFGILRGHVLDHVAAKTAVGLLKLGVLVAAVVVGQSTIIENRDTVSGTGKVAIQGNAAIIEAPDSLLASGRTALPKVEQLASASK